MKLTVLADNNTYIDEYYYGEPGVCYYIEDGGKRILFDLGYSDIFLRNAEKMKVDLRQTDTVVFSHGHNDHTGGLRPLLKYLHPTFSERRPGTGRAVRLTAHPDCFPEKRFDGNSIGMDISAEQLKEYFELCLSREPVRISENIWFLGEIPEIHAFEKRLAIGERLVPDGRTSGGNEEKSGVWEADFCSEDSALVYKNGKRLFVITGCSHSGICNIVSHAERVFEGCSVRGILGGFHLFETDERTRKTIEFLQEKELEELMPCHCVSLTVKCEMSRVMPVREVGVGMCLDM